MSVQTTYTMTHTAAQSGQLADGNDAEIVTKLCETAAGITFGRTVGRGTADDQCVLGGDGIIIGLALRTVSIEGAAAGTVKYAQYDAVNVLRDGYAYAAISEAGSPGNALNSVDATGVIGVGAATTGETDLTGWTLEETVPSGGGVALIRVRS